MRTTQAEFHMLKGHVDDGVEVEMRTGEVLTVRATMHGWQMFDSNGKPVFGAARDAIHLTNQVANY